jgi:hypothetical protein
VNCKYPQIVIDEMKLMNSNIKTSIIILFATALLTGFTSTANIHSIHALPVDLSGISSVFGNSGLFNLK